MLLSTDRDHQMRSYVEVRPEGDRWEVRRIVDDVSSDPVTFSNRVAALTFARGLSRHRRRGADADPSLPAIVGSDEIKLASEKISG